MFRKIAAAIRSWIVAPKIPTPVPTPKIPPAPHTAGFYRPIILQYLAATDNGHANIREILRDLSVILAEQLNEADMIPGSDFHGTNFYWTTVMRHAVHQLQNNGYVHPCSTSNPPTEPGYAPKDVLILTALGHRMAADLLEGVATDVNIGTQKISSPDAKQPSEMKSRKGTLVIPPADKTCCLNVHGKYHSAESVQAVALQIIDQNGGKVPDDIVEQLFTVYERVKTNADQLRGSRNQQRLSIKIWAAMGNLTRYGYITDEALPAITEKGAAYMHRVLDKVSA